MKIRPLQDFVLVLRDKPEERTPGGIIIPDDAQERPQRGTVLAIGPGRWRDNGTREPMPVAVGCVVLFPRHVSADAVARVDVEPDSPVLIRASELIGVLHTAEAGGLE